MNQILDFFSNNNFKSYATGVDRDIITFEKAYGDWIIQFHYLKGQSEYMNCYLFNEKSNTGFMSYEIEYYYNTDNGEFEEGCDYVDYDIELSEKNIQDIYQLALSHIAKFKIH